MPLVPATNSVTALEEVTQTPPRIKLLMLNIIVMDTAVCSLMREALSTFPIMGISWPRDDHWVDKAVHGARRPSDALQHLSH